MTSDWRQSFWLFRCVYSARARGRGPVTWPGLRAQVAAQFELLVVFRPAVNIVMFRCCCSLRTSGPEINKRISVLLFSVPDRFDGVDVPHVSLLK